MHEQSRLLAEDHGEWVFVTDSEEYQPERAWKDLDAAMEELRLEGWEVVQGSEPIRFDIEELRQFEGLGYR